MNQLTDAVKKKIVPSGKAPIAVNHPSAHQVNFCRTHATCWPRKCYPIHRSAKLLCIFRFCPRWRWLAICSLKRFSGSRRHRPEWPRYCGLPPVDCRLIQHSVSLIGSGFQFEMALLDEEGFGDNGRDEWRALSSTGASPRL